MNASTEIREEAERKRKEYLEKESHTEEETNNYYRNVLPILIKTTIDEFPTYDVSENSSNSSSSHCGRLTAKKHRRKYKKPKNKKKD